ncbi:protein Turandot E-like [Drosophila ficusphila]|uniref:protein Turandot E-like n=1 Tax=Drosophila ficusphila TaxID=30025 RepID=UPI0007E5D064|nr:protein Turandot E-like [Drosophila ficusphila]
MKSAIQLSCLLVVFGCLLGSGHAQSNAEFTAKARQMLAIYGNPKTPVTTKQRNLPQLVEFYEKYSSRLQLTNEERSTLNTAVRRYRAQEAMTIDGVPAQGGFWSILIPSVIELLVTGLTKALGN